MSGLFFWGKGGTQESMRVTERGFWVAVLDIQRACQNSKDLLVFIPTWKMCAGGITDFVKKLVYRT
jgi:hypothetical protein